MLKILQKCVKLKFKIYTRCQKIIKKMQKILDTFERERERNRLIRKHINDNECNYVSSRQYYNFNAISLHAVHITLNKRSFYQSNPKPSPKRLSSTTCIVASARYNHLFKV